MLPRPHHVTAKRKTWTLREQEEGKVEMNKEKRSEWKRQQTSKRRGRRGDKNSGLCSELSALEVW